MGVCAGKERKDRGSKQELKDARVVSKRSQKKKAHDSMESTIHGKYNNADRCSIETVNAAPLNVVNELDESNETETKTIEDVTRQSMPIRNSFERCVDRVIPLNGNTHQKQLIEADTSSDAPVSSSQNYSYSPSPSRMSLRSSCEVSQLYKPNTECSTTTMVNASGQEFSPRDSQTIITDWEVSELSENSNDLVHEHAEVTLLKCMGESKMLTVACSSMKTSETIEKKIENISCKPQRPFQYETRVKNEQKSINLIRQFTKVINKLKEQGKTCSTIEWLKLMHGMEPSSYTIYVYGLWSYFRLLNADAPLNEINNLQFEWLRLITFENYQGNGSCIALARSGFYHTPDDGETVTRCFSCGVGHFTWSLHDDVNDIHRELSPNCPLFNNRNNGRRNISIAEDDVSVHNTRTPMNPQTVLIVHLDSVITNNRRSLATRTLYRRSGNEPQQDRMNQTLAQGISLRDTGLIPRVFNAERETHGLSVPAAISQGQNRRDSHYQIYSDISIRIDTFVNWPEHSQLTGRQMAEAGFYYDGHGDTVTCFVCRVGVRAWQQVLVLDPKIVHILGTTYEYKGALQEWGLTIDRNVGDLSLTNVFIFTGDNPLVRHREAFPRCVYVEHTTRTSVMEEYSTVQHTLNFGSLQSQQDPEHRDVTLAIHVRHTPPGIRRVGDCLYTYTPYESNVNTATFDSNRNGNLSETQPDNHPSCQRNTLGCESALGPIGGSEHTSGAGAKVQSVMRHTEIYPTATLGTRTDYQQHDLVADESVNRTTDRSTDESGLIPNQFRPRHPEYSTYECRLSSFTMWPPHIVQRPEQLASAGLYYTGIEDHVRCFACDGGLRKWDPGDDPWLEHRIWFPACPYAGQTKGDEFIEFVQASAEAPENGIQRAAFNPTDIVNDMDNMTLYRTEYQRIIEEHKMICIDDMGFSVELFNEAVKELRQQGNVRPTIEDVFIGIELVTERQRQLNELAQQQLPVIPETPEQLLDDNRCLKNNLTCMKCTTSQVNALFLPRTHHRLCMTCSRDISTCPLCNRRSNEKIITFLS